MVESSYEDNYIRNIIFLGAVIPSDVLPIMHVLWVHIKIYTRCASQKEALDISFETTNSSNNKIVLRLSEFEVTMEEASEFDRQSSLLDLSQTKERRITDLSSTSSFPKPNQTDINDDEPVV